MLSALFVMDMSQACECDSNNIIINELLSYVHHYLDKASNEAIAKMCLKYFTEDDIREAKVRLWNAVNLTQNLKRNNTPGNPAKKKDISDIIIAMRDLDGQNDVMFVARDLSKLPRVGPEECELTSVLERIVSLESAVRSLQDVTSQHTVELMGVAERSKRPSFADVAAAPVLSIAGGTRSVAEAGRGSQRDGSVGDPSGRDGRSRQGAMTGRGSERDGTVRNPSGRRSSQPSSQDAAGRGSERDGSVRDPSGVPRRASTLHNSLAGRGSERDGSVRDPSGPEEEAEFTLQRDARRREIRRQRRDKTRAEAQFGTKKHDTFKGVPQGVDLFVFRCTQQMDNVSLKNYMKDEGGVSPLHVRKLSKEGNRTAYFHVCIKETDKDIVMSNDFWPENVGYRPYERRTWQSSPSSAVTTPTTNNHYG